MFSCLYFLICYICLSAAETHEQQTDIVLETIHVLGVYLTNVHLYVLILALSILSRGVASMLSDPERVRSLFLLCSLSKHIQRLHFTQG